MITIKNGLDLPIAGRPEQRIEDAAAITRVAVLGEEFVGMRPTMKVRVGEQVSKGQVLFEDKKTPGVVFTAPASGTVVEINRGAQRVLQSVVVEINDHDAINFGAETSIENADRQTLVDKLVASGVWTAFKTRPYSKVPAIDSEASAIFVTAMDSNPLSADARMLIKRESTAYLSGLDVLSKLTSGEVFVCKNEADLPKSSAARVQEHSFSGPHPAGLTGTHIHMLKPASAQRTVWSINYQDVIAIGKFFETGEVFNERIIALAGPQVKKPRLLKTIMGACISELSKGELKEGITRVVSGSVLQGTAASGVHDYIGRYHLQVTALLEGHEKEFLGWAAPGANKFSLARVFTSVANKSKLFDFTTTTGGSARAMVPIGQYERVMPLDILPTLLLRDLLSNDTDSAQQLGCLELDEEDLALCTYVCPGKHDFGRVLRDCLTTIEKEG
ncbi:Na(+)-translocating NADH-quinone reductase subunit A [Alginatibacterium sediminis]|uniref:Na(+)-translocating NADH-quinone reductase subunit A n=1 Tax=Alginatibacterium sediminis TaxID=2164068 RepID=A0A420E8E4_9ALTE|nr:Na(+)-translocating NADH-quinone reductase subunit A [Alginatibacterium sediminis]RKF15633.1 Na(+)-translocating NADH-quinone reductase subunit A [Alginatibacterium sediminis]